MTSTRTAAMLEPRWDALRPFEECVPQASAAAACPVCAGFRRLLPLLGPPAMLSDGRRVEAPLSKASCLSCGTVSHAAARSAEEVRSPYDDAYSLGATADAAAVSRGAAYADFILSALGGSAVGSVIDVGCGSGAMLAALAERLPRARLVGLEAAGRLAASRDPRLTVRGGFVEDLERPAEPFDLVCAVNVIEHAHDPALFLRALARQAATGGRIAVVCPRADLPNLELLFFDHVHSLTEPALGRLGAAAGLSVVEHRTAPAAIGDFQLTIFAARPAPPSHAVREDPAVASALADLRTRYLEGWQRLDDALSATLPDAPVPCFGAGEAAALLRTYAPSVWSRVSKLVLDEPGAAWRLDRPVRAFAPPHAGGPILLAVHPARQEALAARLRAHGYDPLGWPATIRR